MLFSKPQKTKVNVYRVLRPILYYGEHIPVGGLVELPRWVGVNLISAGRVELRDGEVVEGFDTVQADPAWRMPGIVQR